MQILELKHINSTEVVKRARVSFLVLLPVLCVHVWFSLSVWGFVGHMFSHDMPHNYMTHKIWGMVGIISKSLLSNKLIHHEQTREAWGMVWVISKSLLSNKLIHHEHAIACNAFTMIHHEHAIACNALTCRLVWPPPGTSWTLRSPNALALSRLWRYTCRRRPQNAVGYALWVSWPGRASKDRCGDIPAGAGQKVPWVTRCEVAAYHDLATQTLSARMHAHAA